MTATPLNPATELRLSAENSLYVATLEMTKDKPCFDLAFDCCDKALNAIGTLRILAAAAARRANGGGV
jgi:hypothetical protein